MILFLDIGFANELRSRLFEIFLIQEAFLNKEIQCPEIQY